MTGSLVRESVITHSQCTQMKQTLALIARQYIHVQCTVDTLYSQDHFNQQLQPMQLRRELPKSSLTKQGGTVVTICNTVCIVLLLNEGQVHCTIQGNMVTKSAAIP